MFPVNELFETIQGEASFTGAPSLFIRLQGCDVGCPWCDTKYTWTVEPTQQVDRMAMIGKAGDDARYALLSEQDLVEIAIKVRARHVVITGGEPAQYDLLGLTAALINLGKTVQIETSGTEPLRVAAGTWVTLSPKINMPGGKVVLEGAIARADEIKVPVGKPADIETAREIIDARRPAAIVWLQPLSMSTKATELCIAAATANGWRVSIQTHRFLGVR